MMAEMPLSVHYVECLTQHSPARQARHCLCQRGHRSWSVEPINWKEDPRTAWRAWAGSALPDTSHMTRRPCARVADTRLRGKHN